MHHVTCTSSFSPPSVEVRSRQFETTESIHARTTSFLIQLLGYGLQGATARGSCRKGTSASCLEQPRCRSHLEGRSLAGPSFALPAALEEDGGRNPDDDSDDDDGDYNCCSGDPKP